MMIPQILNILDILEEEAIRISILPFRIKNLFKPLASLSLQQEISELLLSFLVVKKSHEIEEFHHDHHESTTQEFHRVDSNIRLESISKRLVTGNKCPKISQLRDVWKLIRDEYWRLEEMSAELRFQEWAKADGNWVDKMEKSRSSNCEKNSSYNGNLWVDKTEKSRPSNGENNSSYNGNLWVDKMEKSRSSNCEKNSSPYDDNETTIIIPRKSYKSREKII